MENDMKNETTDNMEFDRQTEDNVIQNRPPLSSLEIGTGRNERKIIPYNSEMEQLKMPEYGRNIQRLVNECLKIEDRFERTRCAKTIARIVATLFPDHVGEGGDMKKIWDHLNIMSDFRLDIDFPVEVVTKEEMSPKPAKIPYYANKRIKRHYGRLIESMIDVVSGMEGGYEKDVMISHIANQMKKQLIIHNPEGVSDTRIINDLNMMSGGRIAIDPDRYRLNEYKGLSAEEARNDGKKKKKKVTNKFKRF